MDRCPAPEQLQRLLAETGALSAPGADDLEAHIEACAACQQVLDELATAGTPHVAGPVDKSTVHLAPPQSAEITFLQRLEQLSQVPSQPGLQVDAATYLDSSITRGQASRWQDVPSIAGYEIVGELGQGGM